MKTCDAPPPIYRLPLTYLPLPPLAAIQIGNSIGNLSKPMIDFAYEHSFDCRGYPYDFSLPEDLYQECYQMPEFDDSLIGEDPISGENEGSSRLQTNFSGPKDDLGDAYDYSYLHQDYWYNDREIDFYGFHSEPLHDDQFPMAYHGRPNHAISGLKFYQSYGQTDLEEDYDRISQVCSASVANLGNLANDIDEDSVEGECIAKGDHSESTLNEAKNFRSYFERSVNSNLMGKDAAHIFENKVDFFISGHNDSEKQLSKDFSDCIDSCVDSLAPRLCQSERQKQPVQNTSMTAEAEDNYSHPNCWNYVEQLKVELQQSISSLTAYVGRLEIQVESLTQQVQDMADKLSGENKLTAPISDHSDDSKAVLEEYEIISSVDEATESKLFSETKDSSQTPDETGWNDNSYISTSDWEII